MNFDEAPMRLTPPVVVRNKPDPQGPFFEPLTPEYMRNHELDRIQDQFRDWSRQNLEAIHGKD